jgi:D-3-phosphoglycerate dehydrogenase
MDILISEELSNPALDRLTQQFELIADGRLWREPERLQAAVAETRVLLVRNQTQVTAELLQGAPNLLGIGRVGVGLDNIDVAAASSLGIVVVAPLNANAASVAELTLGLLLALARKIPQAEQSTRAGGWDRRTHTGIELESKTLSLCGLGRIGGRVARLAKAFGMRLLAYDPFVTADSAIVRETGALLCARIEEAVATADFISVHLPLTPETSHVFGVKVFAACKAGAYFINTARGGVVDETALLLALQSGQLGGAALDVREVEPPTRGALESQPNVILTPHIGAFTREAQQRTFEAVAADAERLLSGQPAQNFVNFDRPRRE